MSEPGEMPRDSVEVLLGTVCLCPCRLCEERGSHTWNECRRGHDVYVPEEHKMMETRR